MDEKQIEIRYFDIDSEAALLGDALLPRDRMDAFKRKAVEQLGITIREGETPLQAWMRAMHEENELPYSQPAHRAISDAVIQNAGPFRFMWALA